jgi:hypothetical protein
MTFERMVGMNQGHAGTSWRWGYAMVMVLRYDGDYYVDLFLAQEVVVNFTA